MALLDDLTSKAKSKYPRILLPESTDSRIIAAAKSIKDQKIAQIVLFDEESASSLGLESINPKNEDLKAQYAQTLFELRKHIHHQCTSRHPEHRRSCYRQAHWRLMHLHSQW